MTDTEAPYQTLQRVLVRMYFDPEFVSRVYACPSAALAGLDVSPRHVSQILATDRRAWQADRLRRRRALKVLMDEFKVTSALVLAASRSLGQLEFFFSSDEFHASVQSRGYMALAYRSYLRRLCQSAPFDGIELSAALTLEGGMAGARRARREAKAGRAPSHDGPETAKAGHYYCCAPGVACLRLPAGTLALVAHLEGHLFELSLTPALALCDDAPRPEPLPAIAPALPGVDDALRRHGRVVEAPPLARRAVPRARQVACGN